MKIFWRCVALLFIIIFILSAYIFWQGKIFLESPMQSQGKEIYFDINPGATFLEVANRLQEQGLIRDSFKFRLLAHYKKLDSKLQAGRFQLSTDMLPEEVLKELVYGKAILHRITIREGLTWWQTGKLLEREGFVRFEDFKSVIMDQDFLLHYGIPFKTAEGFLMPDTYLLKKEDIPTKATAREIAGRLVDTFWSKMMPYWPDKVKPSKKVLREIVILASIVEKETGIAKERGRVAGVYSNRLRIKMPLQADPTIIYGLGEGFDGNLRRKHLEDPNNLYNTYQHGGLPPGPIASPGVDSLCAVINPEKHKFLYFVAITDGGEHAFSRTLSEHNRAVRQYLRNRKKK